MVPSMFATTLAGLLFLVAILTSSACVVSCGSGNVIILRFGQKIIIFLNVKQVYVRCLGGLVNNTVCVRSLYLLCVCVCR